MGTTSPTVAGWELMLRLRKQADERGAKANAVAKALGVSSQYWSQLVKGKGILAEDKLKALLDLLEFDEEERAELLALRDIAKGRNPYAEYSALFGEPFMRFYGLEYGAESIRSFENAVVPGLLQTEDYIRAMMKATVAIGRGLEVEQRVRARLQRQQRLDGPNPLRLSVVMGEAALKYQVGGPEVQIAQLHHLQDLIDRHPETLDVRIIPFEAGLAIAALNSATFHLLSFESGRLPTAGWLETALSGEVLESHDRVYALEYLYDQLHAAALDRNESLDRILRMEGELG